MHCDAQSNFKKLEEWAHSSSHDRNSLNIMEESTLINASHQCKVCGRSELNLTFNTMILGQYPASLFECASCGFQYFHDAKIWIDQAYTTPIANTDTGIVRRSLNIHKILSSFLSISNAQGKFLDWGSGSGLLVRLLRDDGHDCYGLEPYTTPLLAAAHTSCDEQACLKENTYRAIFAIEVVEHLLDPRIFFSKALENTDTLIFSTQLLDKAKNVSEWWYYTTETGQHISFYTEQSLAYIASIYDCLYVSSRNKGLHMITRRSSDLRLFSWLAGSRRSLLSYPVAIFLNKLARRHSLILPDYFRSKEALSIPPHTVSI
jgi:hypothetical protein